MSYVVPPGSPNVVSLFHLQGIAPSELASANTETQTDLSDDTKWSVATANDEVKIDSGTGGITLGEEGQLWLLEWNFTPRFGSGSTDDVIFVFVSSTFSGGVGGKEINVAREQEFTSSSVGGIMNFHGSAVVGGSTEVFISFYASTSTLDLYGTSSAAYSWIRATRLK